MKGLLIKDTKIILNQKRFLILFLFVAVVLSFSMDSSFIVSYIPMIGVIMILSTISYDYHDEGFSFLMTMPIKPGDYAVAKYVFTILGVSVFWVISNAAMARPVKFGALPTTMAVAVPGLSLLM